MNMASKIIMCTLAFPFFLIVAIILLPFEFFARMEKLYQKMFETMDNRFGK